MNDAQREWQSLAVSIARRSPTERREAIQDHLDKGYSITDVILIEDKGFAMEVREVLTGYHREDGFPRYDESARRDDRIRLRTVDGKPLGHVKTGLVEGDARRLLAKARRGEATERTTEFPAEFEVSVSRALYLLEHWGYGLVWPRTKRRNGAMQGEKDCRGKAVVAEDMWRLVEVGSVMEARAREAGELVEGGRKARPKGAEPAGTVGAEV